MYSEHRVSSCILCPALALIELCPGLDNLRRKQTLGPDPSGNPGESVFCSFFLLPPTSLFHSFPLLHHLQDRNPHPHAGLLTSLPFQMAPGIEFKSSALGVRMAEWSKAPDSSLPPRSHLARLGINVFLTKGCVNGPPNRPGKLSIQRPPTQTALASLF